MNEQVPMNEQTVNDIEHAIGELVAKVSNGASRDQVVQSIGDHTKAIISRAAAESRGRIGELFTALHKMDDFLLDHEKRLRAEIDRHVDIANGAGHAAAIIESTVDEWRKKLEF